MQAQKARFRSLIGLVKRQDYLRIQRSGKRWVSGSLVLQYAQRPDEEIGFGITASKKVSKSAVLRNRARRRLRSLLRDILPDHARPGSDFVLIARPETVSLPYADLKKDLLWCLKRLDALKQHPDKGDPHLPPSSEP